MTISSELFMAILSMDSYNRGYNYGIGSGLEGLGFAAGTKIGDASILDVDLPTGSQASGFYAVAYEWGGKTVISYRETDNPTVSSTSVAGASDIWSGWTIGAGYPGPGTQAGLALQFYQNVTGDLLLRISSRMD